MPAQPKVSVVMPVFNMQAYLKDSILSILNQTYKDWELILCDDDSTDDSWGITSKFDDSRIIWIPYPKNTGVCKTINRGIKQATGEYIALVAADDLLTKDSLTLRLSKIGNHDLICGQVLKIDKDTTLDEAYSLPLKPPIYSKYFYGPTNLIHRRVFEKWGLFDESLEYGSDREMWVRLFGKDRGRKDRATFLCLPDIVGYYRVRPDSIQQTTKMTSPENKARLRSAIHTAIDSRLNEVGPEIKRLL